MVDFRFRDEIGDALFPDAQALGFDAAAQRGDAGGDVVVGLTHGEPGPAHFVDLGRVVGVGEPFHVAGQVGHVDVQGAFALVALVDDGQVAVGLQGAPNGGEGV